MGALQRRNNQLQVEVSLGALQPRNSQLQVEACWVVLLPPNNQPRVAGYSEAHSPTNSQLHVAAYSAIRPQPSGCWWSFRQDNVPTARTGGLFGSTTTTTQPSGGDLFWNTQSTTTNTGGGWFGSGTTTTGQSTSGGGLFGVNQAEPAVEACLGVLWPSRRIQTTCSGVVSNRNPIHLKVPLMRIRCWAVSLGAVP